ncbi:MAG: hypothetical protein ACTSQA_00635 [Candidatus Heimdallarchaeaceae archaeon]
MRKANTVYRNCLSVKGNCEYARFNKYGTAFCILDKICQIEHYACTPSEVIIERVKRILKENDRIPIVSSESAEICYPEEGRKE